MMQGLLSGCNQIFPGRIITFDLTSKRIFRKIFMWRVLWLSTLIRVSANYNYWGGAASHLYWSDWDAFQGEPVSSIFIYCVWSWHNATYSHDPFIGYKWCTMFYGTIPTDSPNGCTCTNLCKSKHYLRSASRLERWFLVSSTLYNHHPTQIGPWDKFRVLSLNKIKAANINTFSVASQWYINPRRDTCECVSLKTPAVPLEKLPWKESTNHWQWMLNTSPQIGHNWSGHIPLKIILLLTSAAESSVSNINSMSCFTPWLNNSTAQERIFWNRILCLRKYIKQKGSPVWLSGKCISQSEKEGHAGVGDWMTAVTNTPTAPHVWARMWPWSEPHYRTFSRWEHYTCVCNRKRKIKRWMEAVPPLLYLCCISFLMLTGLSGLWIHGGIVKYPWLNESLVRWSALMESWFIAIMIHFATETNQYKTIRAHSGSPTASIY